MPRTVIAHITDTHIPGADELTHEGAQPRENLQRALVHASRRSRGIIITGDCAAKAGTDAEYAAFAQVIASATVPVWLAPGNHDDSVKMQRLFSLPSRNGRCDYTIDLPGTRVVVLDSTRRGNDGGSLDAEQTEWLAAQLGETPAIIAMHHPCVSVGSKTLDNIRLDNESLARLQAAVSSATARGARVHALVAGHAHMSCFAAFAGVPAIIAPSCAYEFGMVNGVFSYQVGDPQYMEYSWGETGEDFLARVITVNDSRWRTMRG
ncbi:MAG: Ser/Thr protein phosphatase family protein [Actinomycetota bacterium]